MTDPDRTPDSPSPYTPPAGVAPERPLVFFKDLAGQRREVQIEFNGQVYTLRATKNGRLILNK